MAADDRKSKKHIQNVDRSCFQPTFEMDDNGQEFKSQTMAVASQTRNKETNTRRGKPIHTTPKPKKQNPISAAISSWLHEAKPGILLPPKDDDASSIQTVLTDKAPRRWVVYEPMVLLPSGSFTSLPWPSILASSTAEQKSMLWTKILREISPSGALTHLAINEGIPLHIGDAESKDEDENEENTLRSPSGLKILHGNFGPVLGPNQIPTAQDFENAFWVSTKQNGITQIWAPRYIMFSRGNIKEKARLLTDFPPAASLRPSSAKSKPKGRDNTGVTKEALSECAQDPAREDERNEGRQSQEEEKWAIDLYAGIGYFVFSYAKLEFRLLCWEINPWSVEGLRRGALANGWDVVVLSPPAISCAPPLAAIEPSRSGSELDSVPRNGPSPGQATDDDAISDEYDRKLAELVIGIESSTHSTTPIPADNLKNDRDKETHSNPKRRHMLSQRPQIIVILESNEFAEARIRRLRESISSQSTSGSSDPGAQRGGLQSGIASRISATSLADGCPELKTDMDITHINAGFLPSSSKIWPSAWKMMVPESGHHIDRKSTDGWLHLHENVGVHDIERRKAEIQGLFDMWAGPITLGSSSTAAEGGDSAGDVISSTSESDSEGKDMEPKQAGKSSEGSNSSPVQAKVEHVEMVKTFAPDVWHVVFDVHVSTVSR